MRNVIIIIIVILAAENTLFCQEKVQPYRNGDFRMDIKLPHFNTLSLNPGKQFKDIEYGFNGYGIGLEYSYHDKKFAEMSCSYVMTFEWFIPVPVDAEYNKIMFSSFFNLTDNVILGRFTLGYGINYSANTWRTWTRNLDTINQVIPSRKSYTNNNLGLMFNAYYSVGRTLHFGFIYRPSLLNLNNKPAFIYEHLISVEVNWRFKLFNTKMNKPRIHRI